jgi:hypothetical protein
MRDDDRETNSKSVAHAGTRKTTNKIETTTKKRGGMHPFNDAVTAMGEDHGEEMRQLLERFEARALGFRLTTASYQATLRRLLPLLLVPPLQRTRVYMVLSQNGLAASTRSSYWTSVLSLEMCLSPNGRAPDGKKLSVRLDHLAAMEAATLERPTCTLQEIIAWTETPGLPSNWAAAMWVTFLLGQRLSDLCLLQLKCVVMMSEWMAITFVQGKTIPTTGPYTIHVSRTSRVATHILACMASAPKNPESRIFLGKGESYEDLRQGVHQHMERDVRSLRRGGLQAMALQGRTTEEIRLFSRHASVPMLMKYLQNGRVLACQATRTSSIVDLLESNPGRQ